MRLFFYTTITIATLTVLIAGCSETSEESDIIIPIPAKKIEITPKVVDFGRVEEGTTVTKEFTINADGYIESSASSTPVRYGFITSNLEKTIKDMGYSMEKTKKFTLSYTPKCAGAVKENIVLYTDASKKLSADIEIMADGYGKNLKPCSQNTPKISLKIIPDNITLADGCLNNKTPVKVLNFDNITKFSDNITITAQTDEFISGGASMDLNLNFTAKTSSWKEKENISSAVTHIKFISNICSGPASDRILVYGLNGDNVTPSFLYIKGTGTAHPRKGYCSQLFNITPKCLNDKQ